MGDRILGPVQHCDAVADRPAGAAGDGWWKECLAGCAHGPASRCRCSGRTRPNSVRSSRLGNRARTLDLNEHSVGIRRHGSGDGPERFRRGGGPGVCGTGQREESGGEVFAGVEGAPLSEPLLVRDVGSHVGCRGLRTHHSEEIVPARVNDSWMSRTLAESNVYRSGCSRKIVTCQRPQSARNRYLTEVLRLNPKEHPHVSMAAVPHKLDSRYLEALGPLRPLVDDDSLTEIMVNGPEMVYVERKGKILLTDIRFDDEAHLMRVIDTIGAAVGRRIDSRTPLMDARLLDGSRVNAAIPPVALDGPILTIRKFSKDPYQVSDLIGFGTMTQEAAAFIQACVLARANILVSGGTGTGKTTLLNVCSGFIPIDERIVTIEDAAELQLHQEHVCRLEARPADVNGEGRIAIRELVINSLRMRPDRIVVGECRGGEALDMLQAMNTGHDGSLTTIHANSPRETLSRLETLVLMAGLDLPLKAIRQQIAGAINLIIQLNRLKDGSRKVVSITEVIGMEGEMITVQEIFKFESRGADPSTGKIIGDFEPTGIRPRIIDRLFDMGIPLPPRLAQIFPDRRQVGVVTEKNGHLSGVA